MGKSRLAIAVGTAITSLAASSTTNAQAVEQLVVIGDRMNPVSEIVAPADYLAIDAAELLQKIPGANVNSNGSLSGIAQYRGLYGDRVAVSVDGLGTLTGGPSAMDTPLSYASPLLLEHLSLERGIASVSRSLESIGGHVNARYDRGSHTDGNDASVSGAVRARYESSGSTQGLAARFVAANSHHKFAFLGERDKADDFSFPGGILFPTRLDRGHADLSYSYRNFTNEITVFAGKLETNNTGTPALPMDIDFIDTNLRGVRLTSLIGETTVDFALSYSDVDHGMTNYALRTAPANPMGYRATRAIADGYRWRLGSETALADGKLRIGIDGERANHTALVNNPNMTLFSITNFNDADRNLAGIYGQWNHEPGDYEIEAGVRLNRVSLSSGAVGASIPAMNPMMRMMGMNVGILADAFNGR